MDTQQKKATVQRYVKEIWNEGRLDLIDQLMAPDYQNCDPATPGRVLRGPAAFKAFVIGMREAIPDMTMEIQEQYVDGDTVISRWLAGGTQRGPLNGIPATGRKSQGIEGITITRFSGDRIVRDEVVWDLAGMLRQIGVLPG